MTSYDFAYGAARRDLRFLLGIMLLILLAGLVAGVGAGCAQELEAVEEKGTQSELVRPGPGPYPYRPACPCEGAALKKDVGNLKVRLNNLEDKVSSIRSCTCCEDVDVLKKITTMCLLITAVCMVIAVLQGFSRRK